MQESKLNNAEFCLIQPLPLVFGFGPVGADAINFGGNQCQLLSGKIASFAITANRDDTNRLNPYFKGYTSPPPLPDWVPPIQTPEKNVLFALKELLRYRRFVILTADPLDQHAMEMVIEMANLAFAQDKDMLLVLPVYSIESETAGASYVSDLQNRPDCLRFSVLYVHVPKPYVLDEEYPDVELTLEFIQEMCISRSISAAIEAEIVPFWWRDFKIRGQSLGSWRDFFREKMILHVFTGQTVGRSLRKASLLALRNARDYLGNLAFGKLHLASFASSINQFDSSCPKLMDLFYAHFHRMSDIKAGAYKMEKVFKSHIETNEDEWQTIYEDRTRVHLFVQKMDEALPRIVIPPNFDAAPF